MTTDAEYFPPSSGPLSTLTRPVALLRQQPEQLVERAGLRFRQGHDDLDLLDWAEVVGLSGRRYALVRHRRSPGSGTEIVTTGDSTNPERDVQDVLRALDLTDQDLVWTAPDVVAKRAPRSAKGHKPRFAIRSKGYEVRLPLKPTELAKLRKPIRGQGGFQSLLRKLQRQVDGNELQLSMDDVERLVRYSAAYGAGGFQQRVQTTARSWKKAAKKR